MRARVFDSKINEELCEIWKFPGKFKVKRDDKDSVE